MEPAALFKALSDATRLRCIALLVDCDELCVCELTHALELPQPKISHHLGTLRKAGLVRDRKEGLWIYYRINSDLPGWVLELLAITVKGINREQPFTSDRVALSAMADRPGAICSG